ncbi:MAG TPA: amidase family protein [Steroidobacteraceae bacterium]|nr:amidase family protein [Steroidobacteraceae bacterium]
MKIAEYARLDGLGLAELVKSGQVSARELASTALAAIDQLNVEINAVIAKVPEETERSLREGPGKGAFEGVPFLIKDVGSHYANVPAECGSRLFEGIAFPYDSELAARFKKSGVVAVGRSNIPEFGASVSTEPVKHGPTRNPWNTLHTPGGSSGGAAAAVACGMVPVAHANDGGGSIRAPASCCGVFGLKPSRGRQPFGPDQDEGIFGLGCELIVSRSVRDSAAMLDATAGSDIGARYLLPSPPISYLEAARRDPRRLRIAFSVTPPEGAPPLHPECRQAVLDAARLCEQLGHDVFEASPDVTHEESCAVFRDIAAPVIAVAVKMVRQMTGREVTPQNFEATTRAILRHGAAMSAVDLAEAIGVANTVSRKLGRFFTSCDIWMTPVLSSPPLPLGVLNANEEGVDAAQWIRKLMDFCAFCSMFNASGQPAMSVPLHWSAAGLPVGVQFVGHLADELTLFGLAGQLERARPWAGRIPPLSATRLP